MSVKSLLALTTILLVGIAPSQQSSASPTPGKLRINAQGTYGALGVWLYKNPDGTYSHGDAIVGTNETLNMPVANLPPGSVLTGLLIKRHPFDTLGYPMHISLVEKAFARAKQLQVLVADNGQIWTYAYSDPAAKETRESGEDAVTIQSLGPIPADGAIPTEMQGAFSYAKQVLNSIENVPDVQKELRNYSALFVVAGDTIWVELGPAFANGEAPHLGCQTPLGRDMVFGYNTRGLQADHVVGKWLQCF